VTMLLVIVTPLAIYMAADSKQYPSGDNTEKIFLVGNDAIVMHSGIGLIPRAGESGQAGQGRAGRGNYQLSTYR
jgi:hypothetical protein